MAAERYHGADATISIQTAAGTSITVGKLQGVTITPGVELDKLYSADSIKRADVKQRQFEVSVEAEIAEFDVALIQQWQGGSGASSTGMVDTSDPAQFQVTGEVTPSDGGSNLKAVVEEVVFPEMPVFSTSMEEWMTKDISGAGKDLTTTQ